MCCFFTSLFLLGPRVAGIIWWAIQPERWDLAFSSWLWPMFGIVFVPWTTMSYVLVKPGGDQRVRLDLDRARDLRRHRLLDRRRLGQPRPHPGFVGRSLTRAAFH